LPFAPLQSTPSLFPFFKLCIGSIVITNTSCVHRRKIPITSLNLIYRNEKKNQEVGGIDLFSKKINNFYAGNVRLWGKTGGIQSGNGLHYRP
jgi:hypothetical protein